MLTQPGCRSQRCRGPSSLSFETAQLRLTPSFAPCANHITRHVHGVPDMRETPLGATGDTPLEVLGDGGCPGQLGLAGFGPGVTLRVEFSLEFSVEFGLSFEFGFGLRDGDVDHKAESVCKLRGR